MMNNIEVFNKAQMALKKENPELSAEECRL
jgi:hypothetical protein